MYGNRPLAVGEPLHPWHQPPTLSKIVSAQLDGLVVTSYLRAGNWPGNGNQIISIAAAILAMSGGLPDKLIPSDKAYAPALADRLVERRHVLSVPQFDELVKKQEAGIEVGVNLQGQTTIAFVEGQGSVEVRLFRKQMGNWEKWTLPLTSGYSMINHVLVGNLDRDALI